MNRSHADSHKPRFSPILNPNKAYKISGNWPAQCNELKKRFTQLTDEDLMLEPGKEEELFSRIAMRLKKTRHEVISLIKTAAEK